MSSNIINARHRFLTDELLEVLYDSYSNELHYESFFVKEPSQFKIEEIETKREEVYQEMVRRFHSNGSYVYNIGE